MIMARTTSGPGSALTEPVMSILVADCVCPLVSGTKLTRKSLMLTGLLEYKVTVSGCGAPGGASAPGSSSNPTTKRMTPVTGQAKALLLRFPVRHIGVQRDIVARPST